MNEIARHLRIAVRGLLLVERLPTDADRLVVFSTYKDPTVEFGLQRKDLREIAKQSRTLSGVTGYAHWGSTPRPLLEGTRSIVMNRSIVTGSFFDVLGVRPFLGRLLRADDELVTSSVSIVLSYKTWRKQFGADPTVIVVSIAAYIPARRATKIDPALALRSD